MSKIERRSRTYENAEIRAIEDDHGLRLAGTIVNFDLPSDIGGDTIETIASGAISPDALRDVTLLFGHDDARPLARTGAGLHIWADAIGLHYEADLAHTSLARDAYELVKSGVIRGMSIGMIWDRSSVKRSRRADGKTEQVVGRIQQVIESSLVVWPAHDRTLVTARSQQAANDAVERARAILNEKKAGSMSTTAARARVTTTPVDPYSSGSPHSWYRDLAIAKYAADDNAGPIIPGDPPRVDRGYLPRTWNDDLANGDYEQRLKAARDLQKRAGFNLTAGSGGEFGIGHASNHVSQSFTTAARSNAVIAPMFTQLPMPDAPGPSLNFPKFTTSAITAAPDTAEAATITSASPVTATSTTNIAMVVAEVDCSWQLWDLSSGPSVDEAVSRDMGDAIATAIDNQLLNGTNTSGQTLGLLNVSSPNSSTYTQASPTQATFITALAQAWSTGTTARQRRLDTAFVATRRLAWLAGANGMVIGSPETDDTDVNASVVLPPGITTVATPLMPLTVGGNQDEIVLARRGDLQMYVSPVTVKVADQTLAATGQLKYLAYCYLAAVPHRYPGAITIISGTGLAAPAGY